MANDLAVLGPFFASLSASSWARYRRPYSRRTPNPGKWPRRVITVGGWRRQAGERAAPVPAPEAARRNLPDFPVVIGAGYRMRVLCGALTLVMTVAACGGASPRKATAPGDGAPGSNGSTGGHASTTTSSPPYVWARSTDPTLSIPAGPSSTIADLLAPSAPGAPWLAVGARTAAATAPAQDTSTATVWSSADGVKWASTPLSGRTVDTQARAAAQLGTSTVVVGSAGTGVEQRAAVWISSGPGLPFRAIPNGAAFAPNPAPGSARPGTGPGAAVPNAGAGAVMDHIASGALGVFVSGTVDGRAAMWYSTDGTRWTRLAGAETVIDRADQPTINSLLVAPNGVWAAGTVVDGTDEDAAVWTSTDGIHWSRVNSATRSFGGNGDHVIDALTTLGNGFVAVGAVRTGAQWMPASWISPDGVSWSQASESFPVRPVLAIDDAGTTVNAVAETTTGTGLVAVGGSPSAQRVWTSTDGLSWTEVPLPAGAAGATDWHLGLVATDGTTTVLADDTLGRPRLLTDVNGGWHEVTATPAAFGSPMPEVTPSSLVSDGDELYLAVNVRTFSQALGHDASSVVVVSSPDGSTWSVDADGGPFAGHQVHALLPIQGGLAAAGGQATTPGGSSAATIWTSTSGQPWKTVPVTPPTFGGGRFPSETARALARVGLVLVAIGQGGGAGAGPDTLGTSGVPGPSADGPPDQAVAWVSANGGPWQATGPLDTTPGLGTETPEGACAGPQSVVAVGTSQNGSPGHQAMAWSSPSGQTWQSASISPAATPGEQERMAGCLTTGNGFLAYGASAGPQGSTDPALWQSTDGTQWSRQNVTAFNGTDAGAITDLALRGTTWLAVSGASVVDPIGSSAASTVGLWRSGDAGLTWQQLDTSSAPWVGALDSEVTQVGFLGTSAVVVGKVDGRLALWVGTPATPATGAPAS